MNINAMNYKIYRIMQLYRIPALGIIRVKSTLSVNVILEPPPAIDQDETIRLLSINK